jgi:hypothetical protein
MAFTEQFLDELRARVPVSQVVGRKLELKRRGAEFIAFSPFNKESTESFTVNDDKGFWHDFSANRHGDIFAFLQEVEGFEFPAAVEEVAKLAGVTVPNGHDHHPQRQVDWHERSESAGSASDQGYSERGGEEAPVSRAHDRRITRTYDYTDAQGSLIYQVCRIEWEKDGKTHKTFIQRRPTPDNDGEWIWGLSGGDFLHSRNGDWYQATKDRVREWVGAERRTFAQGVEHGLYRLVELNELMSPDDPVFIAEGEKDTDTFREWDFVATTNSGGAANWRPDHAERFRGLDVVIPIDNDEAGRKRANVIGASLFGVARHVRLLDTVAIWPDAPKGADITDWRERAAGTRDRLASILPKLPEWSPPAFVSKFGGKAWETIGVGHAEFYPWVVENIIPESESVLIFGESGTGKSFDAFEMAMCIARNLPFNGANVEPGLVIYIAAEAGKGFEKRKVAYTKHHQLEPTQRLPFFLVTKKVNFFRDDADADGLIEEIAEIRNLYREPLRMIFIDTLSATTPGMNENASQDIGSVKERIDRIRMTAGVAVALVHHKPKGGSTPRGHGSLTADFETTIEFATTEMQDERGLKVHLATVLKQREGKSGLSWKFTLPVVEVGKNKWGNAETSCVVVPVGGSNGPTKGFKLSKQEELIFRALVNTIAEKGQAPPIGFNIPAGVSVVLYADWREAYAKSAPIDDDDDRKRKEQIKKAMQRAGATLLKFGIIGRDNPWVWWTGKPVRGFAKQEIVPPAAATNQPQENEEQLEF